MRFVYFNTGADDAIAVPVHRINTITHDANTSVHVGFTDADSSSALGTIEMTVTDGSEALVVKRIATICSEGTQAITVIAYDTNSQYCHPKHTAVGTITAA